jgi:hypothetical protein
MMPSLREVSGGVRYGAFGHRGEAESGVVRHV